MVMSWIFTCIVGISILASLLTGRGAELAAAIPKGAQAGVTLAVSMAGAICLWSGVGKLMERAGFTGFLSKRLSPLLRRIFPSTQTDPVLAGNLSANICANFLGLGNAATPMGILAAKSLAKGQSHANNELCRLIVLNTASIQLIPTTVASIRSAAGCDTPFDILPAVWLASSISVCTGICAAKVLSKLWRA